MKINFIRHISDDILKENQELKTALVNSKHQLNSNPPFSQFTNVRC